MASKAEPKMILLTGNCSAIDCKKRSVLATKEEKYWTEYCLDHANADEFIIDESKVGKIVTKDGLERGIMFNA